MVNSKYLSYPHIECVDSLLILHWEYAALRAANEKRGDQIMRLDVPKFNIQILLSDQTMSIFGHFLVNPLLLTYIKFNHVFLPLESYLEIQLTFY